MKRKTSAAITTACVGMAVGTAAYMMANNKNMKHRSKQFKKTTGRALQHMGNFIDNVSYMIK